MTAAPAVLTRELLLTHPPLHVLEATASELPDLGAGEPLESDAARACLQDAVCELRNAALAADDVLTDDDAVPSPDAGTDKARLAAAELTCDLLGALARLERALRAASTSRRRGR